MPEPLLYSLQSEGYLCLGSLKRESIQRFENLEDCRRTSRRIAVVKPGHTEIL